MESTLVSRILLRVVTRVLVPAAALIVAGCQAVSGGQGGGDNAADPGDAAAGEATYNQVCAQCHGTPGQNDGAAPDLAGTTADRIAAEVTSDDHGGGRIEGFLDRHYQEMAAYLAGDGNRNDNGADVTTACPFATAADIASVRQSVQADYRMGYSREDELSLIMQGCRLNPTVPYDACVACGAAIVDDVYP